VRIGQIAFSELGGELLVEYLLKQILEAPVIGFEDRVLGREVERPAALIRKVEAGLGKAFDLVVAVVHPQRDAQALEVEHFAFDRGTAPAGLSN
jgi:hypothetical protein